MSSFTPRQLAYLAEAATACRLIAARLRDSDLQEGLAQLGSALPDGTPGWWHAHDAQGALARLIASVDALEKSLARAAR